MLSWSPNAEVRQQGLKADYRATAGAWSKTSCNGEASPKNPPSLPQSLLLCSPHLGKKEGSPTTAPLMLPQVPVEGLVSDQ